jgi:hypothetical protein
MIINGADNTVLERIWRTVGVFLSGMAGYFFPIKDFMLAMLCVFAANFLAGLIADIARGGHWDNRKAQMAFVHVFVFFGIACFVFIIAHLMHVQPEGIKAVSWICYAAMWFYARNILRNLQSVIKPATPMGAFVAFLYYVISLQMIERIPYLRDFVNGEDGVNGERHSNIVNKESNKDNNINNNKDNNGIDKGTAE